jgi:hypothetical protein
MKKGRTRRLDFEIDKLTNSIENTLTGESVETEILRLGKNDLDVLRNLKWSFDWAAELEDPLREVHALTTMENPSFWHGLVSSEDGSDHIFMHLIENAPINKGHDKLFQGVAANLVAFPCKQSFEKGYHGVISFDAKTRLIEHYEKTLGAKRFSFNGMFIESPDAYILVKRYFPDYDNDRL